MSLPSPNIYTLPVHGIMDPGQRVYELTRKVRASITVVDAIRNAPSGISPMLRVDLDNARYHLLVVNGLLDHYLRRGGSPFDAAEAIDGVQAALQGHAFTVLKAQQTWKDWYRGERFESESMWRDELPPVVVGAGVTAVSAPVVESGGGGSSSEGSGSSSGSAASKVPALSDMLSLTKPETTNYYLGYGLAALGALVLWRLIK